MSIIHDALKKVQSKMGNSKVNPEDIVEVLPSEKPKSTDQPKGFSLRSFLTICFCTFIIMGCLYFGYLQLLQNKPAFLAKTNLPDPTPLHKSIEKAVEQSPIANIIQPLMPKKADPIPVATPLAQIVIPETTNSQVQNPTEPQTTNTSPEIIKSTAPSSSTTSTTSTANEATTLNVQGVMTDPRGNVVLINNNVYAEGETVNQIKLIKITMQEITIEHDGKQEVIPVKK